MTYRDARQPISEVRMTRAARPLALVVGLPERAAVACARQLMLGGFVVARAATGMGACERARALRPELIVVSRELWSSERQAVVDVALEVGASLAETPASGAVDVSLCLALAAS
jgi:hypothetical protein